MLVKCPCGNIMALYLPSPQSITITCPSCHTQITVAYNPLETQYFCAKPLPEPEEEADIPEWYVDYLSQTSPVNTGLQAIYSDLYLGSPPGTKRQVCWITQTCMVGPPRPGKAVGLAGNLADGKMSNDHRTWTWASKTKQSRLRFRTKESCRAC